jgi:crossover junction endodeoxyribonuclease RuvC
LGASFCYNRLMKTLSIDPGYERLGLAILDKSLPEKDRLIHSECFKTPSTDPHSDRLSQIEKRIQELLKEFKPDHLAIEDLFFSNNHKTAMKVAEVRGLIIGVCRSADLEIFEYKPQEIKVAVTGDGRSDKNSVIKMIPLLINIKSEIKHDDEYDAIACGLTHIAINPF